MSSIQGGAIRWNDSTAGSPALPANRVPPASTVTNPQVLDPAANIDSLVMLTSSIEEEGGIELPREATSDRETIHGSLEEELSNGQDELYAGDELAAAVARDLEIVEAAMRQHPTGETSGFQGGNESSDDNASEPDEDNGGKPFDGALIDDILQDPAAAFAATIPNQHRLGLLGLLG